MTRHLITLMVFLPFLGALLQAFLPTSQMVRGKFSISRWTALGTSLASALCGVFLVIAMKLQLVDLPIQEITPWIGSYAISYDMALDGLNVLLVLLISIVFPLLVAAEWKQKIGTQGLYGLLLVLQTAFLGAVCAQDLFLLFFFWALSALPFYFLIGIWGGENRESAAFRTIVSASIGNALLFCALILVYHALEPHTFSLRELSGGKLEDKVFQFLGSDFKVSTVAFILASAGLTLRAPIWPFHGWFSQAAKEAPSPVFVALSAVGVPVAMYIFTRLSYSLFPATLVQSATVIVVIGGINLVMGGICALAQKGLKQLSAYICLSEVGMILIGIGSLNAAGVVGSVFQELSLGLGLAGFGLFAGLLFEKGGDASFQNPDGESTYGGIVTYAPQMAMVAGVIVASLLGFPGLSGFVGHALLLIGSYSIHPIVVILAGLIFLLASYFLFTMYRQLFLGKNRKGLSFPDLSLREQAFLLPLVASILLFGIYPKPLIELVRPTVMSLLGTIK
ncbi:MAG: NADH-quinone oxidoreductase subunit M [Methylotenera sp.]|nr:NADH-quinone oxidoreductase subunit M [Oligoflexia bacterium]